MKENNKNRNRTLAWKLLFYVLPGLITLSLNSCFTEYPEESFFEGEDESITDYILANPDQFSDFGQALTNSNLDMTLSARNPNGNQYTLFLPSNDAFERFIENDINYNSVDELLNDEDYLSTLIKYHIVNSGYQTNDFPFGALQDTTLSGQFLNIGFSGSWDSTVFRINSASSIVQPNIQLANGYIHVVDEVLAPVVLNSFEWLEQSADYTIFKEALAITGLKDTFEVNNRIIPSTLLVEPDEVYKNKGINTIDDLIDKISPDNNNYTSPENNLFQFVAYHILEGGLFLNDFEDVSANFNTYAIFPLNINGMGIDILINPGAEVFDSIITENDTILINSIGIDYEESNILTKNGAIHQIDQIMNLYRPRPSTKTFRFYEEDIIREASNIDREYVFKTNDKEKFNFITWTGVEELTYVNTSNIAAYNDDYLLIDGDFEISYEVPKILPGEYTIRIRAQTTYSSNATVWVYLDGKRVGGNIDFAIGPDKWGNEYRWITIGIISLEEYKSHVIQVKSLISGTFYWDEIQFEY